MRKAAYDRAAFFAFGVIARLTEGLLEIVSLAMAMFDGQ